MIMEKLKFYADTPRGERNKLFCWDVSILHLEDAIFRFFARGFVIRAAWYENVNQETGRVTNERIDTEGLFDKFSSLSSKQKSLYLKGQIKSSASIK